MARRQGVAQEPADQGLEEGQRLDKWLWFARVAKTRTLAAGLVADGRVRVNRQRVTKPAQVVRVGDVVTVSVPRGVRVLRIEATGVRRGPATEAQMLYVEIVPLPGGGRPRGAAEAGAGPGEPAGAPQGDGAVLPGVGATLPVAAGKGRPTKRERRLLDRLKAGFEEP